MRTLLVIIALAAVAAPASASRSQRLGFDAEYTCNEARSMSQRTYVNYGQASLSPFAQRGLAPRHSRRLYSFYKPGGNWGDFSRKCEVNGELC